MKPGNVDMLRQALPYINKFKGKTFVIKIGGAPLFQDTAGHFIEHVV